MGKQLSPSELALYRAVDEVLHYVWDPIGVARLPQARDEYHAYLPQVFGMLQEGAQALEIARHLSQITTERMGLAERAQHDLEVAHVLRECKDVILQRQA